jgi:hypothetical protein
VSELKFVAISDDGKMIILETPQGEWIEVPFDASLVAPRTQPPAPVEKNEVVLSPREIQSRIRHGISVEELAALSGSSVERIMAFASPILAERSHVALRASKTIIRRASGAGPLADVIEARLAAHGVDFDVVEWDSFRREDGRWTVIVSYPSSDGVRTGHWLFDVRNSALVPADEEARWLIGEAPPTRAGDTPVAYQETTIVQMPVVDRPQPHLPQLHQTQVTKREVPLPAAPTTEKPEIRLIENPVFDDSDTHAPTPSESNSSGLHSVPDPMPEVVDAVPAAESAQVEESVEPIIEMSEESPRVERILVFKDEFSEPELQEFPLESRTEDAELFTQIPTETFTEELEEHTEPTTVTIEEVEEVFFPSEAAPDTQDIEAPQREVTIEVKQRKAPSWDEILFGGVDDADSKPY